MKKILAELVLISGMGAGGKRQLMLQNKKKKWIREDQKPRKTKG